MTTNVYKTKQEYKYIFSIVMAVYNCEPFLRETLDSIVKQKIDGFFEYENGVATDRALPFEKIVQVIMVDDGSRDGSGAICDEYAKKYSNFFAVHKQNGGVASARNEGLRHVEGKYMNFMDSDDCFSPTVLRTMYRFFEENYDKTDVITMPLRFFDAATGEHWQNYKFKKYSRVANLFNEYDCPLMFVNASFFKSEFKDRVLFDPGLVCGEDIKYICTILSEKMTMGLVPHCHYRYRRRSSGEESLIQTSKKKVGWYFDYFTHLIDWAADFAREKWGYIPSYFQNLLVCDIKWRFLNEYETTALSLLGEQEYARYKEVLWRSLKHFDDKYILEQRNIYPEHKCMMLTKKHGALPEKCIYPDDVRLHFGNTMFAWLSGMYTMIDFLKIEHGALYIDGYTTLIGFADDERVDVCIELYDRESGNSVDIPCTLKDRDVSVRKLDEVLLRGIAFEVHIPLAMLADASLKIACLWNGNKIVKKDIRFGTFSPIGKEFGHAYYFEDGYLLTFEGHRFHVKQCSAKEHRCAERAFLKELRSSKREGARKASFVLRLADILKKFKKRSIWLLMDRPDSADDNAEALFRYLVENKPAGVTPYFVVSEGTDAFARLSSCGTVVAYGSRRHKLLHLISDAIISSHSDDFILNPYRKYFAPYRRYISKQRFVFLQHGISEKDGSRWFGKYKTNASVFIASAEREAQSLREGRYHYQNGEVVLTGMPRYDLLYNEKKRIVTVMFTWRAYLVNNYDKLSDEKFLSSDYYRTLNGVLTSERLHRVLRKHGYKLYFKPHPRLLPYLSLFQNSECYQLFDESVKYRDVFARSALMLTDYSSVAFDFAYLRKPLVYCQFDEEQFFSKEHTLARGYYDYESDGFGEVVRNVEECVDILIEYIENDCRLKELYRERVDRFFAFDDRNNCQRVVEQILKLSEKDK